MITKLEIPNPEQIVYDNGILILTVLGGIKLEGLDRLRVTIKAEIKDSPRPPIRHNLDLYNDTQVEKLIRKTAERLEIGTTVAAASLAELTEQLEAYRVQQIKSQKPEGYEKKQLTEEEVRAAQTFLKEPNLLKRTNDLIGESGVIGEELNRLIMYVAFTSRKREQPLHVVSLGSSGTGKTHLQEKVGQLIPEEDRIEITTLSENAFYYFGQRELKHRVVLIEDLDGAENVLYPMRELMSKRKISKTIAHKNSKGETRTIHLVVEGPVSVSGCTTRESIYEDNANRSFLLYLDESKEQDEKIMQYQRLYSAGKIDTAKENQIRNFLQNCQRVLEPVKVINPYAEELKIPQEVFKPRRSNAHYLAFIEAITFYHQYQREKKIDEETGEQYIETTLEDIAEANKLLKEILLRKSDELSGACRNYFERLKAWMKQEGKTDFTNTQARTALRENHSNQKRYMLQLQEAGLIRKGKGDRKKGFCYEVVSIEEYEQLKAGITSVLDEIYQSLTAKKEKINASTASAVHSSKEVHRVSEPLNAQIHKTEEKKFTEIQNGIDHEKKAQITKLLQSQTEIKPEQGAPYTFRKLQEQSNQLPYISLTVEEVSQLTGKSKRTEARYLAELTEAGLLERQWENKQYHYRIKQ
jgi:predicted transcriptional regulator